ncbi:Os04g0359900, partial [Oryza sativa Japonica Group]
PGVAYVDHSFSISDEDDLVGSAVGGPRARPSWRSPSRPLSSRAGCSAPSGASSWPPTASAATARDLLWQQQQ